MATRIVPPRMPGNYGDLQSAGMVTDNSLDINFQNGERYIQAPTNAAVSPAKYASQGVRMLLNNGQTTPAGMGQMRAIFVKDQVLQTYLPGKAINTWSESESKGFGPWLWANFGPFGDVLGEAEESASPWQFRYDFCPQQYEWITQGLAEEVAKHPGVKLFGLAYASCITIEPNATSRAALSAGLANADAALTLWRQFEWGFVKYTQNERWRYAKALIQAYVLFDDNWRQFNMTRMRIEVVLTALLGRVPDVRDGVLFLNTCVNYNNTYTEKHVLDLGSGLKGIGYEFPMTNFGVQLGQALLGFRRLKNVGNWENPYLFGTDKNKLLPDIFNGDGFKLYGLEGNASGRLRVPSFYTAAPPQPGVEYGYPNRPYGGHDLAHAAALMHCEADRWARTDEKPAQWRYTGQTASLATDNTYWANTIYDRHPHVEQSVEGNNVVYSVHDYWGDRASNGTTGVIEINNGYGVWKPYEYLVGQPNLIKDVR